MPISFVGSAESATATVAIPAHAAGDLLVIVAGRPGSGATPPSLPAGWTSIGATQNPGGQTAIRVGYKIAASSGETSGTWTGAQNLVCGVYRGARESTPIGASASTSDATGGKTTTVTTPALSGMEASGDSWVVAAFSLEVNSRSDSYVSGGASADRGPNSSRANMWDTNGGVASHSGGTYTLSGTSYASAVSFEILAPQSVGNPLKMMV